MSGRGKSKHNPEQKNNNTVEFGHEFGDVNASKYIEALQNVREEKKKSKKK